MVMPSNCVHSMLPLLALQFTTQLISTSRLPIPLASHMKSSLLYSPILFNAHQLSERFQVGQTAQGSDECEGWLRRLRLIQLNADSVAFSRRCLNVYHIRFLLFHWWWFTDSNPALLILKRLCSFQALVLMEIRAEFVGLNLSPLLYLPLILKPLPYRKLCIYRACRCCALMRVVSDGAHVWTTSHTLCTELLVAFLSTEKQ